MHDRIFKGLFRAFLPDLLRLVVPQIAEKLNLSRAVFLDKEFFTDWRKGTRRELDLLAKVPLRKRRREHLFVHVEIEARATDGMGKRLRDYRGQIQARHNCRILSIVVYVQRGKPGIHREALEDDVLGADLEAFRYVSFGLAGCNATEFLVRPEPLAWALAALMDPGSQSRAEHKLACLRKIASAGLNDVQRLLLVDCVEYYIQLTPEEAREFQALGHLDENREVQTMAMTWSERMIAQGRKEGRREGMAEGREQGARTLFLDLLGERFGALPDRVRRQVEEIDSLDRLSFLAKRALTARSLEEIGLG